MVVSFSDASASSMTVPEIVRSPWRVKRFFPAVEACVSLTAIVKARGRLPVFDQPA